MLETLFEELRLFLLKTMLAEKHLTVIKTEKQEIKGE